MTNLLLVLPILFPLIAGALVAALNFKDSKPRQIYVETVTVINSLIIGALIIAHPTGSLTMLQLTPSIQLVLRMDGLTMAFAGMLACLWPLASLYAFEYMEGEHKQNMFFSFYTMAYGIAVGVSFSANLFTMYLFYELLTLITLPIIMHEMDVKALSAGRKYLMYSICGAAFAFMSIVVVYVIAGSTDFTYGGLIGSAAAGHEQLLRLAFVVAFFGFGVKAAVWPLHSWLPSAGVAPTPVTALLHAVAVVKAGVFAIMRVTYFVFGPDLLKGTWAQHLVMTFVGLTIVIGSSMAVKEQHFKRRLAYSTVSNLSYILVGVTAMTPLGLAAGLSHMLFHGIMKITMFFAAGSVIHHSHKEYIFQMRGFGRKMPVTFGCFTVGSLALIGIPGLCGFVSKWYLAEAAVELTDPFGYALVGALIVSAFLTAIYLLTVIITAFCPAEPLDEKALTTLEHVHEAGWRMKLPMVVLSCAMILFGLCATPLMNVLFKIAQGLM